MQTQNITQTCVLIKYGKYHKYNVGYFSLYLPMSLLLNFDDPVQPD